MKILATAGPAETALPYCLDLARGLSRLGHEILIVGLGAPSDPRQAAAAMAIPGLRLVDSGLALDAGSHGEEAELRAAARTVAILAEQFEVDLVQLDMPALAALADFGRPVIALHDGCAASSWDCVQGGPPPARLARRTALLRAGLHAADAVVAPSASHGEAVQRLFGLESAPHTVHHGRSPLAVPAGIPHDFVLTAGPLWDEAGNLGMLDAAAGRIGVPMRAAGPIAGPGGAPVVFDNIHCLGTLGDDALGRWLSARPVFVSAALHEPFGFAVLEAASAGCALILSDIPTYRELWEEVAIFVDPRDEDGFTRAIGDLVGDDFERAVLGRAARERAARYSPDAMAAQMASIYRRLLPAVLRPVLAAARAA